MKLFVREFRRGDVVTVHLKGGSTSAGVFVRWGRHFLVLSAGKIEAGGALRELKSERLLIPHGEIAQVEVTSQ